MVRKTPAVFILLLIFFFSGVFSCYIQRDALLNSLPYDDSWFTRAKRLALTQGKWLEGVGYIWSSKTIYINAEEVFYTVGYIPKSISIFKENMVMLMKKRGALKRSLSYNEDKNEYMVMDSDFLERQTPQKVTKEIAEDLAYSFFKELNKYGLY